MEDLPDPLKESYLRVLVWLVHFGDRHIDERELCEIQVLTAQLRCSAEVRRALWSCLKDPARLDVEAEIERMHERVPSEQSKTRDALKYSLIKDAIRVRRATSEDAVRAQPEIRRLAEVLGLNDEQVEFIENACAQDEKILAGDVSDSKIASTAKSTAEHAAAVGVPVAAIYLSGSVTGLSAAGIVSGIAALGLGGVLGLSAMVTGIGVAVLTGKVAHSGVGWLLRGSARNRASLREFMLQEVLRTHQEAIVNLGEDMSALGRRIANLSRNTEKNRSAIERLLREVTLLSRSSGALARLGERARGFDRDLQKEAVGHEEK